MAAVQEKQDLYFERFAALAEEREARQPAWLRDIRRAAMDRFGDLGFPTTKNEEWRFTNVAGIARTAFVPAKTSSDSPNIGNPSNGSPWIGGCRRLVFVNGRFDQGLSQVTGLPQGVKAGSLGEALAKSSAHSEMESHLARHADYRDHSFVALNTALFEDGALVELAPHTAVNQPIVLWFVTVPGDEPAVTHPRNLVLMGTGAQASFIEIHAGYKAPGPYFTNAVTEVVAGENAVLDYTRIQQETDHGYHVGILQVEQARSSRVTTHTISLGGRLDREEARAVLNGEGAEALLHGLYVIGGHQHVDNHTLIDHAKPHCSSREVYKGVLDGHAGGVFNGKIAVRQDAQKTDSKQSNKNLLLSENATINTKPQLEIFADDVKCTHGATIGQIDAEAVFYLRSRGIGLEEARNLLIQAFANDILDRIKFEPLRASLRETLAARLGHAGGASDASDGDGRVSSLREVG
ncbi:MAG TPA: Fe-S cluster assembly protein SufD [Terriglobia bacterium]|nr:Fe-S cluster assembly protein SufD [Terriglobia bacterium]